MEPIVLTDKSVEPSEETVFSFIGEKRAVWTKMMNFLSNEHREIYAEWRYYNDGKCWLCRGLKKDKAIFWIGVIQNNFRVTFYLSAKAELPIFNSDLPQTIKNEFEKTKDQKFRSVTLVMQTDEDLENFKKLINIKLKLK